VSILRFAAVNLLERIYQVSFLTIDASPLSKAAFTSVILRLAHFTPLWRGPPGKVSILRFAAKCQLPKMTLCKIRSNN
jgi:hypothetical protein